MSCSNRSDLGFRSPKLADTEAANENSTAPEDFSYDNAKSVNRFAQEDAHQMANKQYNAICVITLLGFLSSQQRARNRQNGTRTRRTGPVSKNRLTVVHSKPVHLGICFFFTESASVDPSRPPHYLVRPASAWGSCSRDPLRTHFDAMLVFVNHPATEPQGMRCGTFQNTTDGEP